MHCMVAGNNDSDRLNYFGAIIKQKTLKNKKKKSEREHWASKERKKIRSRMC